MKLSTSIDINAPKETVWKIISDIENCIDTIKAINKIEILEKPNTGILGLKWKETRTMFGKEASETMWITEAEEYKYYQTRAENHGMIYISRLDIQEKGDGCTLTMGFTGEAPGFGVKIMSALMSLFFTGATRKALHADLLDIKAAAEK